MNDTLIVGVITGTVALLSVGLNVYWMGKTFDHLSNAISQNRDQLSGAINQNRDELSVAIKELAASIDKRFERVESDLKQFYKLHTEQAAALQSLKDRNDLK